jgi:hypothetical protein
LGQP